MFLPFEALFYGCCGVGAAFLIANVEGPIAEVISIQAPKFQFISVTNILVLQKLAFIFVLVHVALYDFRPPQV